MAVIHDHPRIALHEGTLEQILSEAEYTRQAEHDFWARIAAERTKTRGDTPCQAVPERRNEERKV